MSDIAGPEGPFVPNPPDQDGVANPFGWDPDMPVVGAVEASSARRGRPWFALIAAALVVVVIGGGALALRSFLSTSVAAASVMSPDTELFVSVDFLQLIEGDALKLNNTIISMIEASGEIPAEDLKDVDGLIGEIDTAMAEALGLDFTKDIRPWVGRTVSLSMSGLGEIVDGSTPDILAVVETRDDAAADQFLSDLAESIEREADVVVGRESYAGTSVYVVADDREFDTPLLFARVGAMVVFGTQSAVEDAIAAEEGTSLADNEGFTAVMESLPTDRLMSFYLDGAAVFEAIEAEGVSSEGLSSFGYESLGASLSIAEYGVRVDSVLIGDDPSSAIALEAGNVVKDLPAGTLVMFGGWSIATYWDSAASALSGTGTDDLLAEAEAELGIDLGRFLELLDRPSAIALVKTPDGAMARELGFPIGLLALLGTSQPEEVQGHLEDLVEYAGEGGFEGLTRTTLGSGTFWMADADGEVAAAVGVTDDYLAAASSAGLVASIGSSPSLADNVQLRAVAEAMGVDPSEVVLFIDTRGLVEAFEAPREIAAAMSPLGALAASYQIQSDKAVGVFVWMIDYVER